MVGSPGSVVVTDAVEGLSALSATGRPIGRPLSALTNVTEPVGAYPAGTEPVVTVAVSATGVPAGRGRRSR